MSFVHLHTHTIYTSGNSLLTIDDLVRSVKSNGGRATAIVDSGTIAGFAEFSEACEQYGVYPIFGCGFYLAIGSHKNPTGRSHLVLLAKNKIGFENLHKLDEIAQSDGFRSNKAHIDDDLLKKYSDGLICLTGGLGGDIDQLIVADDFDAAERRANFTARFLPLDFWRRFLSGIARPRFTKKQSCD